MDFTEHGGSKSYLDQILLNQVIGFLLFSCGNIFETPLELYYKLPFHLEIENFLYLGKLHMALYQRYRWRVCTTIFPKYVLPFFNIIRERFITNSTKSIKNIPKSKFFLWWLQLQKQSFGSNFEKGFLKNLAKFTRKHVPESLF